MAVAVAVHLPLPVPLPLTVSLTLLLPLLPLPQRLLLLHSADGVVQLRAGVVEGVEGAAAMRLTPVSSVTAVCLPSR